MAFLLQPCGREKKRRGPAPTPRGWRALVSSIPGKGREEEHSLRQPVLLRKKKEVGQHDPEVLRGWRGPSQEERAAPSSGRKKGKRKRESVVPYAGA